MLLQTKRSYTDIETGKLYNLWHDASTDKNELISDNGEKVKAFYICAFTGLTIKVNNSKEITLNAGDFYSIKDNEKVTHKRFIFCNRFSKIKE